MAQSVIWFLVGCGLLVAFRLGVLVGHGLRYRPSKVNVRSAERRQMLIKQREL